MHPGTSELRGRVFPVVPTPLDIGGKVHLPALARLVDSIAGHGVGGVVVWSPIGRGSSIGADARAEVLGAWRQGFGGAGLVIASVGAPISTRRPDEVIQAARSVADEASGQGADALVVEPPGSFRGRPDRDRLVLEYHAEIAGAGLPLLVAYRREASGGVAYGPETLLQLLARPEVLGVEVSTIDGIAAFQQVASLVRSQAPGRLVVSGEERFLGYSLLCGADSVMSGLAAAHPAETIGLMASHTGANAAEFLKLTRILDEFARPIFRAPMEGNTLRLLGAMARIGVIPLDAANDPWAPRAGRLDLPA